MAIDFPASPTNGQTFTSGSVTYTWDGTKWTAVAAAGSSNSISQGNTNATVTDTGSDGRFVVTTEGTERARVADKGALIGTTGFTPNGCRLEIKGTRTSNGVYELALHEDPIGPLMTFSRGSSLVANNNGLGHIEFLGHDGTDLYNVAAEIAAYVDGTPGANDMPGRLVFSTTADGASSPTERMRITSVGRLSVRSDSTAPLNIFAGSAASATDDLVNGYISSSDTSSGTACIRIKTNGNVLNTNNSYGSLSDIKLKENIVDAGSQWDDLKTLQVRKYNFKEGQTHTQIGLIAQEVELVSPGLVTESPDRDAEGNDLGTTTKSVNYSVLYMKAVKALQEAMERIEQLEAEMAEVKAQLS